jgi:hypothetical protein
MYVLIHIHAGDTLTVRGKQSTKACDGPLLFYNGPCASATADRSSYIHPRAWRKRFFIDNAPRQLRSKLQHRSTLESSRSTPNPSNIQIFSTVRFCIPQCPTNPPRNPQTNPTTGPAPPPPDSTSTPACAHPSPPHFCRLI